MLRPLADRVLIKPVANPTETESGLHLVEHRKPETQGEVVAVGTCAHPLKDVVENLARRIQETADGPRFFMDDEYSLMTDASSMLCDLVRRESSVKPGDFVIFSWMAGQEILIDDERYLLLHESDLTAVLEPEGV